MKKSLALSVLAVTLTVNFPVTSLAASASDVVAGFLVGNWLAAAGQPRTVTYVSSYPSPPVYMPAPVVYSTPTWVIYETVHVHQPPPAAYRWHGSHWHHRHFHH